MWLERDQSRQFKKLPSVSLVFSLTLWLFFLVKILSLLYCIYSWESLKSELCPWHVMSLAVTHHTWLRMVKMLIGWRCQDVFFLHGSITHVCMQIVDTFICVPASVLSFYAWCGLVYRMNCNKIIPNYIRFTLDFSYIKSVFVPGYREAPQSTIKRRRFAITVTIFSFQQNDLPVHCIALPETIHMKYFFPILMIVWWKHDMRYNYMFQVYNGGEIRLVRAEWLRVATYFGQKTQDSRS